MLKLVAAFLGLSSLAFSFEDGLSLEEKVGQLLMVHVRGETPGDDARVLIQEIKVGGIIYYSWANGLDKPEQVQMLSAGLQDLAKENPRAFPLLIAADQEGGIVARLGAGFTKFPGNKALGETKDPNLSELVARAMGEELKAVGINMNLAPVVDVNSNPRNPIIGIRAFGEDPETVTAFGESALKGYKSTNVIATLKHFPGHGDVEVDSHEDLPVILKTKEELQAVELLPFKNLAGLADVIMTAHILVPAFDPKNCSTLSEKTLNYLRETIGFKGVIIADSLVMQGVLKQCGTVDEAAIKALQAGCDILLLGGRLLIGENSQVELTVVDIRRVHKAIVEAVKSGRVSEERVDEAVQRILDLKKRYLYKAANETSLEKAVATASHKKLALQVASQALKITQKEKGLPSLHGKKVAIFSPGLLQGNIEQTSLLGLGSSAKTHFYSGLSPAAEEIESFLLVAKQADVLLICSYNAWKNPSQIHLIQALLDTEKFAVLLVMRDPLDASLFPKADCIFSAFSPTAPSIQAICGCLAD